MYEHMLHLQMKAVWILENSAGADSSIINSTLRGVTIIILIMIDLL